MKYDTVPQETLELIHSVLTEYHPDLCNNGVTVDALFALADEKPLKVGGYPVIAFIKINSTKLRIKGLADCEITIDKQIWESLTERQKISLLDHELTHINVKKDKDGVTKTDDCNRPALSMRRHDYQLGWFREVANRHGENSTECYQAKLLLKNDGKIFFPEV